MQPFHLFPPLLSQSVSNTIRPTIREKGTSDPSNTIRPTIGEKGTSDPCNTIRPTIRGKGTSDPCNTIRPTIREKGTSDSPAVVERFPEIFENFIHEKGILHPRARLDEDPCRDDSHADQCHPMTPTPLATGKATCAACSAACSAARAASEAHVPLALLHTDYARTDHARGHARGRAQVAPG